MRAWPNLRLLDRAGLVGSLLLLCGNSPAAAANVTACTTINLCYCINSDNRDAIAVNVASVRKLIAEQKAAGKAIGYLSIPLSTAGGSYFDVSRNIAASIKEQVEKRYGAGALWILNPGAEGNLPAGASGADYMYMWTQILEGRGLGEDFDFFYFSGPSNFAHALGLTGDGDMEKIDAYFDKLLASDAGFKKAVDQGKVTKTSFRNYYALRASGAFSLAHMTSGIFHMSSTTDGAGQPNSASPSKFHFYSTVAPWRPATSKGRSLLAMSGAASTSSARTCPHTILRFAKASMTSFASVSASP